MRAKKKDYSNASHMYMYNDSMTITKPAEPVHNKYMRCKGSYGPWDHDSHLAVFISHLICHLIPAC